MVAHWAAAEQTVVIGLNAAQAVLVVAFDYSLCSSALVVAAVVVVHSMIEPTASVAAIAGVEWSSVAAEAVGAAVAVDAAMAVETVIVEPVAVDQASAVVEVSKLVANATIQDSTRSCSSPYLDLTATCRLSPDIRAVLLALIRPSA